MAAPDGLGWRLCCKVVAISPQTQKGEPARGSGSGGEVLCQKDGDCQRRAWLDASLAEAALGQRAGPWLCPYLLPWDFRTDFRTFSLALLPAPLTLKLRGHARQRRSEPRTWWPQHASGWVGQGLLRGILRKPTFAMLERYVFLLSLLTNTVTSVKNNTQRPLLIL